MRIGLILLITLTIAILFFSVSTIKGQSIDQVEIQLGLKNETLIKAFRKIEATSPFHFMYRNADVKNVRNLNIPFGKQSVEAFLEAILENTSLHYKQVDNRIHIISSEPNKNPETRINSTPLQVAQKQTGNIKGNVTDSQGNYLAGVSIKLEGPLGQSRNTDAGGMYNFKDLSPGIYKLTFSFLGFAQAVRRLSLAQGEQLICNTILNYETRSLDEVLFVAFGVQKKALLATAVSSIRGETIARLPVANISNALGGRLPGLITSQGSGEPGNDEASFFIRGISSNGATQPLLVVDGIPRSFTQLDPQTIESITVLKDATSAAPYGVAGANGVIIVTTKMGKSGSPALTLSSSYGLTNLTTIPDLPSSYEFALLKNAAAINEKANTLPYTDKELEQFKTGADPDKYPNTDAHDILINRNTPLTSHSIQMAGGTDRFSYYASLGYMFQQGIFEPIKANRYTLSMNLEGQITPTTTVSLKVNSRQQNNSYSGITTSELFVSLNYALPVQPIFWSNSKAASIVYPQIYESGSNTRKSSHIFSQLSIDQKLSFIPGLNLKGTIAYDPSFIFEKRWVIPTHVWTADFNTTPYTFRDAIYGNPKASLIQNFSNPRDLTYQMQLNYSRNFGKSEIGALALFEARSGKSMNLGAGRLNYNLLVDELSVGSSNPLDISNTGNSSQSRQMGLVYRLNYSYGGKYSAEATGRYDGHYYFAPGMRYGFFPAASVAWRVSEEAFIRKRLPFISNLKLRASYGEVGALAGLPFQYLSTYTVTGNAVVLEGTAVQGITERPEPNPNITWERSKKTNIGIESSFWNDLLMVDVDYFFEKRSNMLIPPTVTVPQEYGIGLSQINDGKMKNEGYEIAIGSRYSFSPDLQVSLNSNITHAKNTVLQIFENPSTFNNPNRRLTGRSLGTQFGYDAIGFYQPHDFLSNGSLKPGIAGSPISTLVYPGDLKYRDINGDLKINQDDIVPIGDPSIPQIMYGINPNIRYKAFQLDIFFQGAYKRDVYLSDWAVWPFNVGRGAYKHNLDYWRPDNQDARNPRITSAPAANNTVISSWWMNDSSYLRLKNVQLSYALPESLIARIGIRSATLTVAGQNLKTWTKMKYDYDPESTTLLGGYPSVQVISMGINVSFN